MIQVWFRRYMETDFAGSAASVILDDAAFSKRTIQLKHIRDAARRGDTGSTGLGQYDATEILLCHYQTVLLVHNGYGSTLREAPLSDDDYFNPGDAYNVNLHGGGDQDNPIVFYIVPDPDDDEDEYGIMSNDTVATAAAAASIQHAQPELEPELTLETAERPQRQQPRRASPRRTTNFNNHTNEIDENDYPDADDDPLDDDYDDTIDMDWAGETAEEDLVTTKAVTKAASPKKRKGSSRNRPKPKPKKVPVAIPTIIRTNKEVEPVQLPQPQVTSDGKIIVQCGTTSHAEPGNAAFNDYGQPLVYEYMHAEANDVKRKSMVDVFLQKFEFHKNGQKVKDNVARIKICRFLRDRRKLVKHRQHPESNRPKPGKVAKAAVLAAVSAAATATEVAPAGPVADNESETAAPVAATTAVAAAIAAVPAVPAAGVPPAAAAAVPAPAAPAMPKTEVHCGPKFLTTPGYVAYKEAGMARVAEYARSHSVARKAMVEDMMGQFEFYKDGIQVADAVARDKITWFLSDARKLSDAQRTALAATVRPPRPRQPRAPRPPGPSGAIAPANGVPKTIVQCGNGYEAEPGNIAFRSEAKARTREYVAADSVTRVRIVAEFMARYDFWRNGARVDDSFARKKINRIIFDHERLAMGRTVVLADASSTGDGVAAAAGSESSTLPHGDTTAQSPRPVSTTVADSDDDDDGAIVWEPPPLPPVCFYP